MTTTSVEQAQEIANTIGVPVTFKGPDGRPMTVHPKSKLVAPNIAGGEVEIAPFDANARR